MNLQFLILACMLALRSIKHEIINPFKKLMDEVHCVVHLTVSTIIGAEVGGKQTANSGNPRISYEELITNFEPGTGSKS